MAAYLLSPLTWTLTALCGEIVYIVVIIYRDAVRERRERKARFPDREAKLRAAQRPWEGRQK